ncbi:MAG: hypothetical protein V4724_26865 [Pseudomonadota bacterium]
MNWRTRLRAAAMAGLLIALYADAARSDAEAQMQVLVALEHINAGWHP